jgi:hypothetical protein
MSIKVPKKAQFAVFGMKELFNSYITNYELRNGLAGDLNTI